MFVRLFKTEPLKVQMMFDICTLGKSSEIVNRSTTELFTTPSVVESVMIWSTVTSGGTVCKKT